MSWCGRKRCSGRRLALKLLTLSIFFYFLLLLFLLCYTVGALNRNEKERLHFTFSSSSASIALSFSPQLIFCCFYRSHAQRGKMKSHEGHAQRAIAFGGCVLRGVLVDPSQHVSPRLLYGNLDLIVHVLKESTAVHVVASPDTCITEQPGSLATAVVLTAGVFLFSSLQTSACVCTCVTPFCTSPYHQLSSPPLHSPHSRCLFYYYSSLSFHCLSRFLHCSLNY